MTNLEKIFRVETLLRQYALCELNSIDEVRYSSQGLIKNVQHTQVNKSKCLITLTFYENKLK